MAFPLAFAKEIKDFWKSLAFCKFVNLIPLNHPLSVERGIFNFLSISPIELPLFLNEIAVVFNVYFLATLY